MYARNQGKKTRVRCLGPRKREHTFWTVDKAGHRVCPACEVVQRALRLPMSTGKDTIGFCGNPYKTPAYLNR
jgi:hypothetical protein